MKKLTILLMAMLMVFTVSSCRSGANEESSNDSSEDTEETTARNKKDNIIGDWFAQIDFPQSNMTILMEINILDKKNCVIDCKWIKPSSTKEESGRATYRLDGNQLIITFLNDEELIHRDNVFDMENVYDIKLQKNKLVILNNPQFRNVDVTFGKGYKNRGFAEIIFPD